MLTLVFKNTTAFPASKAFFEKILQHCAKMLRAHAPHLQKYIASGTLELILVSDIEIRRLNKAYRHKDTATDVLTFSFLEGMTFPPHKAIGEMYISIDRAKRQAKDHGHALDRELKILFIHGVLHAFGFDHEKGRKEAKIMQNLESAILGM